MYPRLQVLLDREFSRPGDPEEALRMVRNSRGLESTRFLAGKYFDNAAKSIRDFKSSEAKDELVELARKAGTRKS